MARTKQTARKALVGKAPIKRLKKAANPTKAKKRQAN